MRAGRLAPFQLVYVALRRLPAPGGALASYPFAREHLAVDLAYAFDRIDLRGRLVVADAHDARKAQRKAALVQIAGLNDVERNLEHDPGLYANPVVIIVTVRKAVRQK